MATTVPVILAGGSGTRLWPLSRSEYPKQFFPLLKETETLLQTTLLRTASFPNMQAPIVVCHEDHRFIVAEQLREIGIQPAAIILEPDAKNTAPAIALAAIFAQQHFSDAVLWVMPADHVVENHEALLVSYVNAQDAINADYLVSFGIEAKEPKTAYGYIKIAEKMGENSVYKIDHFVEKPNRENAQRFIESGHYYWNCGIFAFKAESYLRELKEHEPKMAMACEKAMKNVHGDGDFLRPDAKALKNCPANSIDYAVMEKTEWSAMTVLHSAWNDVGSWDALMQEHIPDEQSNVKIGDVLTQEVTNSYLRTNHGLLAVSGVDDVVVVVTDDAVLVAKKDHCQKIKHLVGTLKSNNRPEAQLHSNVHRPWGSYHTLAEGKNFKVKKIIVNPEQRLSLQRHKHRSEHWVVIKGTATVVNGDDTFELQANESTFIPANTKHRLSNEAQLPLELIEVQVGAYLGEDDIERFSDSYGRAKLTASSAT